VAEIAEKLYGGGGHKYAAGFKVKNAKLKQENGKWSIQKSPEQQRQQ
jgi:nanoRNase/pAp phosphatase (c-di-AMP/oligoRNAs hydrolase)